MEVVVLDAGGDDGVPGNDVAEWHGVEECFGDFGELLCLHYFSA